MQIVGSGTGNYASTAIVDTSQDDQHGRLWTNSTLSSGTSGFAQDKSTTGFITVAYAHHELHDGKAFHVFLSGAGGNGTQVGISIDTANTNTWTHIITQCRSSVEAHCVLWEGGTISGVAGVFNPFNRNRNSANVSVNTIMLNPVISGGTPTSGTALQKSHFGSNKTGDLSRGASEWILKSGTSYLFVLESEAASADLDLQLDWYEHTDKIQQF